MATTVSAALWEDSFPLAAAGALSPTFDQLFTEHAAYVGRALRYLGVPEADLEDACQEVFLVIHRRGAELDGAAGTRAWVRQICVFVAQNARRTNQRRREAPGETPVVAAPATQHATAERNQQRARLLRIIDALSAEQRVVFVLYEIEQLTMAEIATAVGCPVQTAYSRLHAARARVESQLQEAS